LTQYGQTTVFENPRDCIAKPIRFSTVVKAVLAVFMENCHELAEKKKDTLNVAITDRADRLDNTIELNQAIDAHLNLV
jgi:hypothetical protein